MRHGIAALAAAGLVVLTSAGCQSAGEGGGLFGGPRDGPETLDAGALWQVRGTVSQALPRRGAGAEFAPPVVMRKGRVRTVCGWVTPQGEDGRPGTPLPYIGGFAGRGFMLITVGDTPIAARNTLQGCADQGATLPPAPGAGMAPR